MEQEPKKGGISRRDLFARFRKQPDTAADPTQIQTDLYHDGTSPTPAAKAGNGLDRRHFLKQATVAAIGAAGAPTSALDALNQIFGITAGLVPAQHENEWLVETTKLLDETWNNIAYNQTLTLPAGASYHSYFYPGVSTTSLTQVVAIDAKGCSELMYSLRFYKPELAALQQAGRLPVTANHLLTQVVSDASGSAAKSLHGKFTELANGNLNPLESVTRPLRRLIDSRPKQKTRESYERTEGWQRHIDQERIDVEQAKEREWYAYVWNK